MKIDYGRLEELVSGRAIVVTGGGGSIGAEICDRIVTFGAARLLVIENSEPALHAALEALVAKQSAAEITGRIADIRDRERIFGLIANFKPDIVFHAAALKHVPILERDWDEGIKTNVFGSINVADAAAASGASAMVMISTDKAIEPVSVLGATKRLAEMYCEALDKDFSRRGGMRLISVRFGNVLASNGSVVPKFKAQIEAGGPVTVTHPDMVRYFMTIREACDLVITAASHALGQKRSEVSVYVLNMGQPVKIVDLAERIIRLSGLEPGRDIEIKFTGIRPGERLHEILFAREEETSEIGIPGIVAAKPVQPSLESIRAWLGQLEQGLVAQRAQHDLRGPAQRGAGIPRRGRMTMDVAKFFKSEFAEHGEVARKTEGALGAAFAGLLAACVTSMRGGGKIMFFGNGGSAADAQHLATELTIRYKKNRAAIAALALTTDTSALTAAGNDLGFEQIFARQIAALGRKGDVAIAISTSGKSANILAALRQAKSHGPRHRGLRRQRRRRHGRPCRPSAGRALGHHRPHPGDAHHAGADAVRRAGDRTGPGHPVTPRFPLKNCPFWRAVSYFSPSEIVLPYLENP